MVVDQRQPTNNYWSSGNNLRGNKRGVVRQNLSSGVLAMWYGLMRYWYSTKDRPEWKRLRDKIRHQAEENAVTLTVILFGFILTWAWILVAVTFFGGRLH